MSRVKREGQDEEVVDSASECSLSEAEYATSADSASETGSDPEEGLVKGGKGKTATMASVFQDILKQRPKPAVASARGQRKPDAGEGDVESLSETDQPILARRPGLLKKPAEESLERRARAIFRRERRAKVALLRVKPDLATDGNTERVYRRTATRGVVQLFNAVQKHQLLRDAHRQKQLKANPSGRKEGESTKTLAEHPAKGQAPSFMDLLKTGPAKIL